MFSENQPASLIATRMVPSRPHLLRRLGTAIRSVRAVFNPSLLRLSLGLCALLMLACTTLMSLGRVSPGSDRISALGLSRCDGVPCFRGITPGKTRWKVALATFGGRSITQGDLFAGMIVLLRAPDGNESTLDSILIDIPRVNLGEIITVYGTPTCVTVYPLPDTLILHYPDLHIVIRFSNDHITPLTPVLTIIIGNPQLDSNLLSSPCSATSLEPDRQGSLRRWHGFSSLEHYLSAN